MAAWRSTLLRCLASTEAIIDFGEDEEISSDVAANVLRMARQLYQQLQQHVSSSRCLKHAPQVEWMDALPSDVALCHSTSTMSSRTRLCTAFGACAAAGGVN